STNLNTQSRTVTISGNTATFSGAMPNNIGVGDVLQYQNGATYLLAFIHGRTSATTYTVYTSSGGTPTATTSAAVSVYRAYTSLFSWEAQSENASINSGVRNFDTSTDLTAGDGMVMNVAAYASSTADTAAVTIDGWTTSATNYIRIYTATSTSEVGESQRHAGVWDTGRYNLSISQAGGGHALGIQEEYVRIEGIQIYQNVTNSGESYPQMLSIEIDNLNSDIRISYNILKANYSLLN
ncbi:MAG: hypothetical protein ABIP48_25150, partial [Planctomycetota bacterium]